MKPPRVCPECGCICGHFNGCPEAPETPDDDDSTQDGCESDSTEDGCNENG